MEDRIRHWSWLLVGGLAILAGCGSTPKASTTGTSEPTTSISSTAPSSTAPSSSGPASVSPTTASPPQGTVTTTIAAGLSKCSTAQLVGSLGSANGTAGTIYYQLVLRNASNSICFVEGYPGVSFVASGGRQVGDAATRMTGPTPRVELAPQQSAAAILAIVDASNYGTPCQITDVAGLRVYPPDQTAALFVAHSDKACANLQDPTLRVGPLKAA